MTGQADLKDALLHLAALGPQVIVKDGANGSYAYQDRQILHAPAIPVTALDTTGAGDVFNAGFLRAWLDGLPPGVCLRWGNIAGGLSTTAHGATGCVVTKKDVEEWLMSGK